jgi:simple sugar transport system permease protein
LLTRDRAGPSAARDAFFLPDLCDMRVLLGVVLSAQILALVLTMVMSPADFWLQLSRVSLFAQADIAGAIQVQGVYHRLIPSISSGYGFLGLLVGMLVNYQAIWIAPVAFFFAALNIGSIQLPIVLKLDSALSGVLQGALVLFVLLMQGVQKRMVKKG